MLGRIFRRHRWPILLTYAALLSEGLLEASLPWFLGLCVDDLLSGSFARFWLYVSLGAASLCVGVVRRVCDTRVFGSAWRRTAVETVAGLFRSHCSAAKTITCAQLAGRFIDFLEFHVPLAVREFVAVMVALAMLWRFVPGVFPCVLLASVAAFAWVLRVSFARRAYDEREQEATDAGNQSIQDGELSGVRRSYAEKQDCYVRSSDWQAAGRLGIGVCSMVAEIVVVCALVETNASPGRIVSAVTYVWSLFGCAHCFAHCFVNCQEVCVAADKISRESRREGGVPGNQ